MLAIAACDGGSAADPSVPREAHSSSAAMASAFTSGAAAPTPATSPTASISATPAPSAASATPLAAVDLAKAPALFDESGTLLPQTKDEPTLESPAFKRRVEL